MIRLIIVLFFLPVFIQSQPTEDWLTPFATVEFKNNRIVYKHIISQSFCKLQPTFLLQEIIEVRAIQSHPIQSSEIQKGMDEVAKYLLNTTYLNTSKQEKIRFIKAFAIQTIWASSGGEGDVYNLAYTGGIVQCTDANFINNEMAVQFFKYPSGNEGYFSNSNFSNCSFITDDGYFGESTPSYFVKINEINNISFLNCTFSNNSSQENYGSGIYAFHSDFDVKGKCTSAESPCTSWDYGTFENLLYGIYTTATGTERFAEIDHVEFNNNHRGIFISGMTNAVVTNNNFNINSPFSSLNGGYGLYLSNSTAYTIEENNFFHEGQHPTGIGLIVHNSGVYPNEIYRNWFTNLVQGISCQEQNRDTENQGLQLLCNDFEDCEADVLVPQPKNKTWGIALNQGIDGGEMTDMAGNLFFYNTIPDDYDDLNNEGAFFKYFYPQNPAPGFERTKPEDYTTNSVKAVAKEITIGPWNFNEGCPTYVSGGSGEGVEMRAAMVMAQQQISGTEATLFQMIDGGNTEALNSEVETSIPPQTIDIYNELMNKSPNLSNTVVESSIEKETVLPNTMIRDVMVANPATAKSDVLMDKLDERLVPLPEYMKAQILQGRSLTSLKEEMESNLAGFKLKKARAFNGLSRYFVSGSSNMQQASDSLKTLYQSDNALQSKYRLCMLYMEQGEYQQGIALLNSIPAQFGLSGEQLTAHQNIESFYGLEKDIREAGHTWADATEGQLQSLTDIEAADAGTAGAWARDVLVMLGEMAYDEPIEMPDMTKSSEAIDAYDELLSTAPLKILEVYPNPSRGYIILEYRLETASKGTIEIRDVAGQLMHSISLTKIQDQVTVVCKDWKPGVYIASIKTANKSLDNVKFTLVK